MALCGIALGLAFAGSPKTIAPGVRVAGVDVSGLTPGAATTLLEQRAKALEAVPVTFQAAGHTWRLQPRLLGIQANWGAAVNAALREGGGFGPLRGLKRLDVRVFGTDIAPSAQVYEAALQLQLDRIAQAVDVPHRDASLALNGLAPTTIPDRTGHVLDRRAAAMMIVRALTSLTREPVELPVHVDKPTVTPNDLTVVSAEVKTALSAPISIKLGATQWHIASAQIASLLELPANGRTDLRVGGAGADAWFAKLERRLDRAPKNATWSINGHSIRVLPDHPGYTLDVPRSANAVLHAALVTAPDLRLATLVGQTVPATRTTAEAQGMHIVNLVSAYQTIYGGDPNRIHNVQLVAHLIDGHLIAPGATFSFNQATGARTAAKGFEEAPVIINGELATGLGGGVCQVSTTVFNAAYEAGLPITARTNHALYISHYPQGRDATVNYPDVDLKFVNDTSHWMLLRTWVGPSALTVALYGTSPHRRVVSEVAPLVVTGQPPLQRVPDPSLPVGEKVLQDAGSPSRSTSVRRLVYTASGKLLYDTTFYSSYRSQPKIVLVGTKQVPKSATTPSKSKSKNKQKATTSTTQTTTATTPTTPRP